MGKEALYDIPGLHKKVVRIPETAAGTDKQYPLFKAGDDIEVKEVNLIPDAALAGVDDNNFTAKVMNVGALGVGTTEVATGPEQLAAADWVALKPVALTVSATLANRQVAAGEVLVYKSDQKGTGLIDPVKAVEVLYQYKKPAI